MIIAGSERVKHTGNTGERLGESKAINSSLMTLRYCLENLRWNQRNSKAKPRQLPFRQSKVILLPASWATLTSFLRPALCPLLLALLISVATMV